jgi:hypothetical protein
MFDAHEYVDSFHGMGGPTSKLNPRIFDSARQKDPLTVFTLRMAILGK